MKVKLKDGERLDDLQRNGYRIIQDPQRFCFGMDAVLLCGFADIKENARVMDLGTGTGVIPILLAARTQAASFVGLEVQEESADMAARSVRLNDLEDKIRIQTGNLKDASKVFGASSFDVVLSNPPYMNDRHGLKNPRPELAIARHEVLCNLGDVVREAAALLVPGGKFFMVHRPFRLPEIMEVMRKYKLEPKRMRLVYPKITKEPNMVLIEGVRGCRARMKVEKPLIIYDEDGNYNEEIYWIYDAEGASDQTPGGENS